MKNFLTRPIGLIAVVLIAVVAWLAYNQGAFSRPTTHAKTTRHFPVEKTDAEWRKLLTPEQYRILREKGTEEAFTGKYAESHDKGTYVCAADGNPLFSSDTKFDSGTGWPSFWQPLTKNSVLNETDSSFGMKRTEVLCARCGGHLGHVFEDGPKPTGLRYCMNSAAMKFVPAPKK